MGFYDLRNVLNNQAVVLSLTKQYAKNTKHNTATGCFLSDLMIYDFIVTIVSGR